MPLLERIDGGMNRANSGIELAALGISTAVSGLETTVATLDGSLPSLSESASALRNLAEGLGSVAFELAAELPKATRSLQDVSPELGAVVGILDQRFEHLDVVVTELAGLMEAVVGTIPGMRRVPAGDVDGHHSLIIRHSQGGPMGSTGHDSALAVVKTTYDPIHDIGTAIYLSPDVMGWAAEWGWSNPFAFYFAGRGGMLGDVGADVVTSAFGWFQPDAVKAMYTEGIGVAPPKEAAARMAEAHSKWGRKHYADVEGLDGIVAVTEEVVDGLEGSAIPLFVGWRDAARCETAAGRAAQLMQMLREWRGGLHLVATTAVGLSPLEAILTNEGPGQANFFGWAEPFPDCADIKAKHDEAEEMTNRLCAAGLAQALDPSKLAAFEAGVRTLRAATP